MTSMTATYSPDDNKLRLYASSRLDAGTYNLVKDAGFRWAPKQELFVAPMWTPQRADLLIDLCGEIGDEDTSLVDRAEERADRFEELSEKRGDDAERAYSAVQAICDNIPMGQPILVGHHSEKHARKEAERIESGMKRAVNLWETSKYWTRRAAGALRHAKYKEQPGVRHRRIKGIEADKRKAEKNMVEAEKYLKAWQRPDLTRELALRIANYDRISRCFPLADFPRDPPASQYEGMMGLWSALTDGIITAEQAAAIAIPAHQRSIAWSKRWIEHYDNRLEYERAMLDEQGGLITAQYDIEVGGKVLCRGEWLVVLRVNKALGVINSVTTQSPRSATWTKQWKYGIEEVKDYAPPTPEVAAAAKAATKLPPMCNFPGEGFIEMTKAEWDKKVGDYKQTRKYKATADHGPYRQREAWLPSSGYKTVPVFLTDAKRVDPPSAMDAAPIVASLPEPERIAPVAAPRQYVKPDPTKFDALKETMKQGVQVVSANQLFPTPRALAERMAKILDVQQGHRVLEPSAGTGMLIGALGGSMFGREPEKDMIVAVEVNAKLADRLRHEFPLTRVHCADFLSIDEPGAHVGHVPVTVPLGMFDRIIMNPPFENASDIKHISHALAFLNPGGIMVAICANGSRQNDKLRPLVEQYGGEWEDLPANTFAESGTGVSTALLTFYN